MTSRRKSRELAFIALYQLEVGKYPLEELIGDTIRREEISTLARPYFRALVRAVWNQRQLLDALVDNAAAGWRVERINKLDLSLLRLTACELTTEILSEKAEAAIVINEAVVLAKRYCGDENARFINGILGKIAAMTEPLKQAQAWVDAPKADAPPRKVLPKVGDPLAARKQTLQEIADGPPPAELKLAASVPDALPEPGEAPPESLETA